MTVTKQSFCTNDKKLKQRKKPFREMFALCTNDKKLKQHVLKVYNRLVLCTNDKKLKLKPEAHIMMYEKY